MGLAFGYGLLDNVGDAYRFLMQNWEPGDRLYLMTDALAQWFLHAQEQGGRPWQDVASALAAPQPDAAFAAWIEALRGREALRNDDVTLLALGLPRSAPKE